MLKALLMTLLLLPLSVLATEVNDSIQQQTIPVVKNGTVFRVSCQIGQTATCEGGKQYCSTQAGCHWVSPPSCSCN